MRNQTHVRFDCLANCIGRQILSHWTTKEALWSFLTRQFYEILNELSNGVQYMGCRGDRRVEKNETHLFLFFFCLPRLLTSDFITEEKQRKYISIGVNWAPISRSICSESYWKFPPSIWLRTRHFLRVVKTSKTALGQSHWRPCHPKTHSWKTQTVTRKPGMSGSEHLAAQRSPTPSRI